MTENQGGTSVPVTADALVVIRERHLAERTGLNDPYCSLFITDAGQAMAAMAQRTDRVYVPYNMARFRFFADTMVAAAGRVEQVVLLGAGYDSRPIWLPGLADSPATIFEVDYPGTLDSKRAVLAANGVDWAGRVVSVGADLGDPDLFDRLAAAGLDRRRPAAVFVEGVVFFLPPTVTARLVDPMANRLAAGTTVMFDYFAAERIERLNEAVRAATGRTLFRGFPYPDEPAALAAELGRLGYEAVEVRRLGDLADAFWPDEDHADPLGDWNVVTARMA